MTDKREYAPWIKRQLKQLANQDMYLKRKPRSNTIGQRFGRLEVIRAVGHGRNGRVLLLCHCECGGATIQMLDALQAGTKSCGCLAAEIQSPAHAQVHKMLMKMATSGVPLLPAIAEAQAHAQAKLNPTHSNDDNVVELAAHVASLAHVDESEERDGHDDALHVYEATWREEESHGTTTSEDC